MMALPALGASELESTSMRYQAPRVAVEKRVPMNESVKGTFMEQIGLIGMICDILPILVAWFVVRDFSQMVSGLAHRRGERIGEDVDMKEAQGIWASGLQTIGQSDYPPMRHFQKPFTIRPFRATYLL